MNRNEDNENLLGYDLYNSALADILSEPSLSMPITVGLYAKWGSGKSFLLSKLRGNYSKFNLEISSIYLPIYLFFSYRGNEEFCSRMGRSYISIYVVTVSFGDAYFCDNRHSCRIERKQLDLGIVSWCRVLPNLLLHLGANRLIERKVR